MKANRDDLIYRLIEYGIKKEVIVKKTLYEEMQLTDVDQAYFEKVLKADATGTINPNHLYVEYSRSQSTNHLDFQYKLTPIALFHYNDYQELKEARANARSANRWAMAALIISILGVIVQISFS